MHCLLPFRNPRLVTRIVLGFSIAVRNNRRIATPRFDQATGPSQQKEASLYQEGMRLLHQKDYPQALEQFRQLEQSAPDLPQGYTGEGIALALNGKIEEAIPVLQKAIAIDPAFGLRAGNSGFLIGNCNVRRTQQKN